eukprot:13729185-Alexandrium_andersonii.AAC.1
MGGGAERPRYRHEVSEPRHIPLALMDFGYTFADGFEQGEVHADFATTLIMIDRDTTAVKSVCIGSKESNDFAVKEAASFL